MKTSNRPRLTRPLHPMPAFVLEALKERKLLDAYRSRLAYQRNDYVGWIARAKLATTRERRLAQMLDELARGDVYMNMRYAAKAARGGATRRRRAATTPTAPGTD
jgi:Bacteriocin-protection, YdeI or OmpD-Associated